MLHVQHAMVDQIILDIITWDGMKTRESWNKLQYHTVDGQHIQTLDN